MSIIKSIYLKEKNEWLGKGYIKCLACEVKEYSIFMKPDLFYTYRYLFNSILILIFITFISHIFRAYLDIINIALIHIIPVAIVSMHGNMKSTVFITLISVICFNFLYIPPLYSFSVHNELYIWSFFIFGIVGWIITYQAKNLSAQKRQNELRESLLHIISHDLRTPLATMHGTVNLILANPELNKEKTMTLLEDINYASLRMKRLITNLFDSARFSNKEMVLKLQWCDFEDMIGVALQEFSQKQTDDILKMDIQNIELFWGDNMLLTQLLVNLLDNALKYATPGTDIFLKIESLENTMTLSIFNKSDHLDKKKLKNIFDKFYRLEDTNDISGSGIGLALCKSIVTLHGGTIKAETADGGMQIDIELPIIKKAGLL